MKRLTCRQKQHQLRRQRYQAARPKNRHRSQSDWLSTAPARNDTPKQAFLRERSRLPPIRIDYLCRPKHAAFLPPKVFSLAGNYEETLAFLMDFSRIFAERRRHRMPGGNRRPYYAEFGKIEQIDPGAGLALAAEIDSFAASLGRPVVVLSRNWKVISAYMSEQMGVVRKALPTRAPPPEE